MEISKNSYNLPKPRDEVEKMNIYSAPLEGRREFLRLDFNENTLGPSPLVIEAIKNIPSDHISIYPEYNGLKEAVANNLNSHKNYKRVNVSQIGLFNGVDAAIHAIFHAYGNPGDYLLTTIPTFGYYNPCAHMQGMRTIAIPYENDNFIFPFDKISDVLREKSPKLLLICNPNNPTGTRLSPTKICKLAELAPKTLVVIDELYEAFTGDSVLPQINFSKTPNLLVLRSLSKTAGLAGLRIGFAVGYPEVVSHISRVTGPYDINSFAVTAAFAALKDQLYIDNYVEQVLKAKEWLHEQLKIHQIKHHIDGGNYLLIWPQKPSDKIATDLKSKGILIRNMDGKTLIGGSIRVSIGTIAQMKKFLEAFIEVDNN